MLHVYIYCKQYTKAHLITHYNSTIVLWKEQPSTKKCHS